MLNRPLLIASRFRANPHFNFIPRTKFSSAHCEQFSDLLLNEDFAGLLVPSGQNGLTVKALTTESADLFLSLQGGGYLSNTVRESLGERANQAILKLLMTGVLEVEVDLGFTYGEEALLHYVNIEDFAVLPDSGFINQISIDAIRYAQNLPIDDVGRLSARLYFFNRHPVSCQKEIRAIHSSASSRFGSTIERLNEGLVKVIHKPDDGWLFVSSKAGRIKKYKNRGVFKLYVSPITESLIDRLDDVVSALSGQRFIACKMGLESSGLQRPDKFIIYCDALDDITTISERLLVVLDGSVPHGVPFTTSLHASGILSWGFDPPPDRFSIGWLEKESWRIWLTNRIAASLLFAKNHRLKSIEPWQFALTRLEIDGIDTRTWSLREIDRSNV